MKKKILMLSQTVFPPDIRLEKEIKTLFKNDYEITVLCNQYEKNKTPDYKYCRIKRIKAVFNSPKANRIFNFPLFFNPRYVSKSVNLMFRFRPDIIHAHDLPMAPLGLILAKIWRIPIIYDMHENYPEALLHFKKKGIFNVIFKNHRIARMLDKICIKYVNKIIVVVEENRERIIKKYSIKDEDIHVVSNTVDLDSFAKGPLNKSVSEEFKDKYLLLYTGTVSPERGLETPV
ncbi:glycosyltransferase, partial [Bacteroidota bacterium]